jgi:lipopolysaccharide transport system ATP-binding protein
MPPAIRVDNVGKSYRITHQGGAGYRTLRETLTDLAAAPWRRLRDGPAAGAGRAETFWALRDVSFEVQPGEVLGVIGRNGAGKSTLLKLLASITKPTTGQIALHGRVGSLLEVGTGFHPELTGRENIYLNGAILGMKRWEIARKFDQIVAFAEIDKFLDTPVKRYSSGMYVRLAFAVAAHLEPEILIVDEVLAVGDAGFQRKCLGRMGEVARQGRTILFVSHNMGALAQLCHRALWLENGAVERSGACPEVIGAYLTTGTQTTPDWLNPAPCQPGAELRIDSACVLSPGGEPCTTVEFVEPFTVEVAYTVVKPVRNLSVLCRLLDSQGNILWTSWDTDTTDWGGRVRPPGRYRSRCTVPGSIFRPGRYLLTVGAQVKDVKVHMLHENVLAVDVSEVGFHINPDRVGLLTPLLEWQVERGEASAVSRDLLSEPEA